MSFFGHFLPSDPFNKLEKTKFWKTEKNTRRYHHFTFVYHKWQQYDVWFLRNGAWHTQRFVILDHFLPFYPQTTQKWKKAWRYYHFTHVYHKSESYDVWFLKYWAWKSYNFLSFWAIFCPFTPLPIWKIKILKKRKQCMEISSSYHDHMLYCSWNMALDECNFYFSFWAIFCPLTPLKAQKIKI